MIYALSRNTWQRCNEPADGTRDIDMARFSNIAILLKQSFRFAPRKIREYLFVMYNVKKCASDWLQNTRYRLTEIVAHTPVWKKLLASIGSNTFFVIQYWKFAKKVLDPILTNIFFSYGHLLSTDKALTLPSLKCISRRCVYLTFWHYSLQPPLIWEKLL